MYRDEIAGGLILIGGAVVCLALPRRRVRAASAVALLLLLVWAAAPYTGVSPHPVLNLIAGSTSRYMMPALMACALAVALTTTESRSVTRIAQAALAAALIWNLYHEVITVGIIYLPSPLALLGAAAAGAVVVGVLGVLAPRVPGDTVSRLWSTHADAIKVMTRVSAPALAVAAFAALAPAATNFAYRHARVGYTDSAPVSWMVSQPGFAEDRRPVAMTPSLNAMLAGDRLSHPLLLLTPAGGCASILARARGAWVVVQDTPFPEYNAIAHSVEACLRGRLPLVQSLPSNRIYRAF